MKNHMTDRSVEDTCNTKQGRLYLLYSMPPVLFVQDDMLPDAKRDHYFSNKKKSCQKWD